MSEELFRFVAIRPPELAIATGLTQGLIRFDFRAFPSSDLSAGCTEPGRTR